MYTISVQAGNRAGLSVPVTGTARTYSDGELLVVQTQILFNYAEIIPFSLIDYIYSPFPKCLLHHLVVAPQLHHPDGASCNGGFLRKVGEME